MSVLIFYFFMIRFKTLLLLFFISLISSAQTKVSGVVLDQKKQPVPFANVSFKGGEGVQTDDNGKFVLTSKKNRASIAASFIGYIQKEISLTQAETINMVIVLEEEKNQLKEIIVLKKPKKHLSKKENPAYRILQGIWANKKRNGLRLVKAYDYKKYTSIAIGLSNLDSIFMKKTLGKAYDSVIHIIEHDKKIQKYNVPIYLKEINEVVYGNTALGKEKIDKLAERSVGVGQQGFIFDRISNAFAAIDIYENDIVLLNKNFISPISERGYGVYEYVLRDSIVDENNKKSFQIYFFPRQSGDLVFEGNFKVTDKTFAISNISMKVNKGINLNLVRNLSIEKDFRIENDSMYLPDRDFYEGDFTLLTKNDDEKGLFVRKNIVFSDYDLNPKHEIPFYSETKIQSLRNEFDKDDDYWNGIKTKDNSLIESRKIIDELKNNPKIKRITGLINILATGYVNIGHNLQFGSLYNVIANNDIEGLRLRAGFRTFKTVDDLFRTHFYGVYGTKDKHFKYGIEAKYLISQSPRIVIGASRIDDNLQFGGTTLNVNDLWVGNTNTNLLINRGLNNFISKVEKNSIMTNFGFTNNFRIILSATQQKITSAAPENIFNIDYGSDASTAQTKLTDFNTSIALVYTPNRFVYGFGVEQRFGRSLYATSTLKLNKGISGIAGSQFNYHKIQFSFEKPVILSNFGILDTYFEVGKTFGAVPLPLLSAVPANQGYSVVPKTFILLDYFDMVTDSYIMAHFNHHFNGLIFNRLPLLKKINLREVAFYRCVLGSVSDDNVNLNKSLITYASPNKKVYAEYGFGIENIGYGNFRPIRLDFVWRTNFIDVNGLESPKFGVRIELRPEF